MLDKIKKLGLNEYEARAYRALLKAGNASAVGVSRSSGIPRARVYDVLFSLEKKGFVVKSASRPVEFRAISPNAVFESIALQKRAEFEEHLRSLEESAGLLEGDFAAKSDLSSDGAWVVEGRRNIYSLVSEELKNCNERVVICSTEEGLKRKNAAFGAKLEGLSRFGVKVQTRKSELSDTSSNSDFGGRDSQARFVVFDSHSVLLFLNNESKEDADEKAVFIKSPVLARHFSSQVK